jgi:membrane-associated PAP2 superfamily phosphatase
MTEAGAPTPSTPLARHPLRRARVRAGWHGLAGGLVLAIVFTAWPGIDLWASSRFLDAQGHFVGNEYLWVRVFYVAGRFAGGAYAALSLAVILVGHWRPALVPFRWRRRAYSLLWVVLLAAGLAINAGLKEHWGRARPVQVTQFGGERQFSPVLLPTDQCERNCSFSSGHAAAGFVIMSIGLMGPVAVRRRWWWFGVGLGAFASLARVMQGGHFLSDTLFSGWLIWACGWLIREAWIAWVARRRRRRAHAGA